MDKLELLQHVVRSLTRKRPPLELGHDTGVTQLLNVVDLRHPAHHLLTSELLKCLEVEMPKPFMLAPGLIILMSGKAEGPGHLHVKHVQPVVPAVDLGEKTTAAVPDPEHPSVNLHSRAALIKLAEADDGVLGVGCSRPHGATCAHRSWPRTPQTRCRRSPPWTRRRT
jgi:hypothetical protein